MSKPPKPTPDFTITVGSDSLSKAIKDKILGADKKPILIKEALIKDGFCHYKYEINDGVGAGDEAKVDGAGIVMDSMYHAFQAFHVHFAILDEVFKNAEINIDDLRQAQGDKLTMLYAVTSFKVTMDADDVIETVILSGTKHLMDLGQRYNFTLPKVALDELSSYKWKNELKAAVEHAISEVESYKDGNYIIPDKEDAEVENGKGKKKKGKQLTIADQLESNSAEGDDLGEGATEEDLADFENAKA